MDSKYGKSIYHRQANTTLKWCPSDSEAEWNKNIKIPSSKNLLETLGWTENSIEYTFNSSGFRADEFDDTGEGIVFLGCSYTLGTGMDLHRTWSYRIASHFGLKYWNLGQGGGANDTCYRLGSYWIPKLKPKMVCMLAPSRFRMEIAQPTMFEVFLPNVKQSTKYDFYQNWLSTDINTNLNIRKNIDGLHLLCSQLDIPFYSILSDEAATSCRVSATDMARDLMHPGSLWNENVANKFMELINE